MCPVRFCVSSVLFAQWSRRLLYRCITGRRELSVMLARCTHRNVGGVRGLGYIVSRFVFDLIRTWRCLGGAAAVVAE